VPGGLHVAASGVESRTGGGTVRLTGVVEGDLGVVPSAARLADLPVVGVLRVRGGRLAARVLRYGLGRALLGRAQGVQVVVQGVGGGVELLARLGPSGGLAVETVPEGVAGRAPPAVLGVDLRQSFAGLDEDVAVGEQGLCGRGQGVR
jgi:hypothetical protein